MTESTPRHFQPLYFDSGRRSNARRWSSIDARSTALRRRTWRDPLVVGVAATALTSIGAWIPSKWNDEIATQVAASRTLPQLWAMIQNIDAVHGLYYAFMHFWIIAFGTSNLALRAPSLIAVGIAAAGVVVLGKKLATRRVALTSGIVFMMLPRVTWMGIEARSLAGTAAIAVWLTILLVILMERHRTSTAVLYGLLGAVGVCLNIYLALLIIAHGVALLIARSRILRFRRVVLAWGIATACVALLASPVIRLATSETAQLPFGPLTFSHVANSVVIGQFFSGATPTFAREIPVPPTSLWGLAALVAAIIGWLCILAPLVVRRLRPVRLDMPVGLVAIAAPWVLLPPALILAYSLYETPIYTARYFSFATPAVALLIGSTLAALFGHRARLLGALAIFALIVSPLYLVQRTPTAKNGSDWEQAAAILQSHASPGQDIYYGMTNVSKQRHESEIAYGYPDVLSSLNNLTLKSTGIHDSDLWGTYHLLPTLAPELATIPHLWAVLGHDGQPSPEQSSAEYYIEAQGLHLVHIWRGTTTDVLEFSRTAN